MNDERLIRGLAGLRGVALSPAADDRSRNLLERAWTGPRAGRGLAWRRALVVASSLVAAVAVLGRTALLAAADTPLYAARIAVEDIVVAAHVDAEDRYGYVLSLAATRDLEAARFERAGNEDAAAHARAAEQDALRILGGIAVAPAAAAYSSSLTASGSPSVAATPITTYIVGTVRWPDRTNATGVCVSIAAGGRCFSTTVNGSWGKSVEAKIGQTITLYFQITDPTRGGTFVGSATATVGGSPTSFGAVSLRQ
ncbi:MAG: hypothetical protein E6I87_05550 [Chloroflexi bacterium]|nr:MAG: hypothetical protein E6I87_05550 [Chloroflexota bacterium]